MWVKWNGFGGRPSIIKKRNYPGEPGCYNFVISDEIAEGRLRWSFATDWVHNIDYYWTPSIGQWYFIATTYDSGVGLAKIFIDGTEVKSESVWGGMRTGEAPTLIGRVEDSWPFNGTIDEVAIYDVALTAANIELDYYRGLSSLGYCDAETYSLTVGSTAGGNVTAPGEGTFAYDEGVTVDLVATPDEDYQFAGWMGDVGSVADVNDATTAITMNGDYSITANFELVPSGQLVLTTSSTAGGSVTDPGEGTFVYDEGTVVDLVATPDSGYLFYGWTGNISTVGDINDAATTVVMNDDYSITANFGYEVDDDPYCGGLTSISTRGTPMDEVMQTLLGLLALVTVPALLWAKRRWAGGKNCRSA